MTVKIIPYEISLQPRLADAELHFEDGPLAGLKLIGFAIWQRRSRDGYNVTFPARQYAIRGERRRVALLQPIADRAGQDRIYDLILTAYREHIGETS